MEQFDDNLESKKCEACEGFEEPLDKNAAAGLLSKIDGWHLAKDTKSVYQDFVKKNFLDAVDFVNKIAHLAEAEGHHPDIHLTGYKNLRIELSTHAIGGLSLNDFIMAAKINQLHV